MDEVSKKEGRTILFVSHNMNAIEQLCSRVVLLDKGKVIKNSDNVRMLLKDISMAKEATIAPASGLIPEMSIK